MSDSKTCPNCKKDFHREDCLANFSRQVYCSPKCAAANRNLGHRVVTRDSNFDQLHVGDTVYFNIDPKRVERTITQTKGGKIFTIPSNTFNYSEWFTLLTRAI